MTEGLISICIPAYKQRDYVIRCLESILKQDYKNIEVIISDDSPGEDIKQVVPLFEGRLIIRYYHNHPALKTPRNWNAALDAATGDYALLMHQDDWFHASDVVSSLYQALQDEAVDFAFCRNTAIDEKGDVLVLQAIPSLLSKLSAKPDHLLLAQVIGPPSNTLLRKKVTTRYDERFIWLVDVDYYNRILKAGFRYKYIDRHLVSIGLHAGQATVFCREHPELMLRENILVAKKIGEAAFRDIKIYDYYWRLLRNHGVNTTDAIEATGVASLEILPVIRHMLSLQRQMNRTILKMGVISKAFMSLNYLSWRLEAN